MATPPDFSSGSVLTADQLDKVGLWRVYSADFSGAYSYQWNSLFTSDFLNYRIHINYTSSVGDNWLRLCTSGTANTTNNYISSTIYISSAGATASYGAGTSTIYYYGFGNTNQVLATCIDIYSPQTTNYTRWTNHSQTSGSTYIGGGYFSGTTQFDGLYIQNGGGNNVAGRLVVYGYNNL